MGESTIPARLSTAPNSQFFGAAGSVPSPLPIRARSWWRSTESLNGHGIRESKGQPLTLESVHLGGESTLVEVVVKKPACRPGKQAGMKNRVLAPRSGYLPGQNVAATTRAGPAGRRSAQPGGLSPVRRRQPAASGVFIRRLKNPWAQPRKKSRDRLAVHDAVICPAADIAIPAGAARSSGSNGQIQGAAPASPGTAGSAGGPGRAIRPGKLS